MTEVHNFCLDAALDNNEGFGIWGAITQRERRRIRRNRRVADADAAITEMTEQETP